MPELILKDLRKLAQDPKWKSPQTSEQFFALPQIVILFAPKIATEHSFLFCSWINDVTLYTTIPVHLCFTRQVKLRLCNTDLT